MIQDQLVEKQVKVYTDAGIASIETTQVRLEDGTVIPAGTTIQKIIEGMLLQINPPTYIPPIFNLSGDGLFSVEAGTKLNPTLVPNFIQNDAGTVSVTTFVSPVERP